MKIAIQTTPTFYITPTSEQLVLLARCSQHHYDSTCRAASLELPERETIADHSVRFVSSWQRMRNNGFADVPATKHQLDIALKCMEIAGAITLTPDETKAVLEMRRAFRLALSVAGELVAGKEIDTENYRTNHNQD